MVLSQSSDPDGTRNVPPNSILRGRPTIGALFRACLLQLPKRLKPPYGQIEPLSTHGLPRTVSRVLSASGTLFALLLVLSPAASANETTKGLDSPNCEAQLQVETATIERITDGDTVVLSDNRRVRLIGINTPELNEPDKQLQQAAVDARNTLQTLLPDNEPVLLYVGRESNDRHGRLLAHVVRQADQLAVAPVLLKQGQALHSAVAPNTLCATHFAKLENAARTQKIGVWQFANMLRTKAANMSSQSRGFKLITGTITQVQTKPRHTQLTLDNRLAVLVRKELASQLEKAGTLRQLLGQPVEVRGWLSGKKNNTRLWLQHSANLRQLAE